MKAPEVKNRKTAKNAFFALLIPKCTFGPKNHFLSILSILEHFCTFFAQNDQKWLHASLWNTGRERFGQKVELFTPECPEIVKIVKKEPFLIFEPKNWFFALFLTFRPWGGHLPKTVKNLVVYEDFWEPKSQKSDFGLILPKFHIFLRFGAPKRKKALFRAQNEKIAKFPFFCVLAVRTDRHTHSQTQDRILSRPPLLAPLERSPWEGLRSPPPLQ